MKKKPIVITRTGTFEVTVAVPTKSPFTADDAGWVLAAWFACARHSPRWSQRVRTEDRTFAAGTLLHVEPLEISSDLQFPGETAFLTDEYVVILPDDAWRSRRPGDQFVDKPQEARRCPDSEYLSVPQCAAVCGVEAGYVRRAIKEGKLTAANIGSEARPVYRVFRPDLDTFMRGMRPVYGAGQPERDRLVHEMFGAPAKVKPRGRRA